MDNMTDYPELVSPETISLPTNPTYDFTDCTLHPFNYDLTLFGSKINVSGCVYHWILSTMIAVVLFFVCFLLKHRHYSTSQEISVICEAFI